MKVDLKIPSDSDRAIPDKFLKTAAAKTIQEALKPLSGDPKLRNLLVEIKKEKRNHD